jgi:glycosyltransferase involved in cell wall biosynthesis
MFGGKPFMSRPTRDETLVILSSMYGFCCEGGIHVHLSFGRVIDNLAWRYRRAYLSIPIADRKPDETRDYRIQAEHIETMPLPFFTSSVAGLKKLPGLIRAYRRVCRTGDAIWIRGMLPYVIVLYWLAFVHRCKVSHWIVGNPVALLRTHRRAGRLKDMFSLLYAYQDRLFTKLGSRLAKGAMVCNGGELGEIFKSPRTVVTVSSTVTEDEFFEREDTCQGEKRRILFIGFIRPEKGFEYLIEAVSKLNAQVSWELVVVGSCKKFHDYRARLDQLVERLGIGDRISWEGYVPYGPQMFRYLRESDVLVLPTLSEGTPRVLIEARANSLPIIATNVGGIPTSVTDGVDGLLVPPRDAGAIVRALDTIFSDGELRRSLIRNGLRSAKGMVVDRFVDVVARTLEGQQEERSG